METRALLPPEKILDTYDETIGYMLKTLGRYKKNDESKELMNFT